MTAYLRSSDSLHLLRLWWAAPSALRAALTGYRLPAGASWGACGFLTALFGRPPDLELERPTFPHYEAVRVHTDPYPVYVHCTGELELAINLGRFAGPVDNIGRFAPTPGPPVPGFLVAQPPAALADPTHPAWFRTHLAFASAPLEAL